MGGPFMDNKNTKNEEIELEIMSKEDVANCILDQIKKTL